jgi:hypothetical protein
MPVMSDKNSYPGMKEDPALSKCFPPCRLAGLDEGLCWRPPEQPAETTTRGPCLVPLMGGQCAAAALAKLLEAPMAPHGDPRRPSLERVAGGGGAMQDGCAEAELAPPVGDPWRLPLVRVRGKVDWDGMERVSSQTLLDLLQVPHQARRAPVFRRLAKIMAELGSTAVRVRDLTRGGYKEQVRGYCRDARHERPTCRPAGAHPLAQRDERQHPSG